MQFKKISERKMKAAIDEILQSEQTNTRKALELSDLFVKPELKKSKELRNYCKSKIKEINPGFYRGYFRTNK